MITKKDKMRNKANRKQLEAENMSKVMEKSQLKCFEHMKRMEMDRQDSSELL